MLNKLRLNRIVTLFIVLFPIFFRYKSFISAVTLAEMVFLPIAVVCFIQYGGKLRFDLPLILFLEYLAFRTFLGFSGSNQFDEVGTGLRILFLYVLVLLILPYFDYDRGIKYLNVVSIIICVYGLLQIFFYSFGIILTTEIPGLVPYRNAYSEMQTLMQYGFPLRIRSIFGEPAELCEYLFLPITINLFNENRTRHWLSLSLFYSMICVISLSSTAIVVVAFIWAVFLYKNMNHRRGLVISLIIAFGGIVSVKITGIWDYFIYRVFNGTDSILNSTRFRTLNVMTDGIKGITDMIIGAGMSEPEQFLPGFARLYLWLGIIGVITYVAFLIYLLIKYKDERRIVITVFILLNFAAAVLFGCYAVLYLTFVFSNKMQNDDRMMIGNANSQMLCGSTGRL